MDGLCVDCGATTNIEIHHVKKLSNLNKKGNNISRIIATLGRK